MAEKPILFNTEMVRAILEGRKTQTRRLVKDIPLYEPYFEVDEGMAFVCDEDGVWHHAEAFSRIQPGDVLWVRETWCQLPISPGGHTRIPGRYYYKADPEMRSEGWRGNWKPSIHMPRKAARLFLRVNAVRMERLKDITEHEAIAEGFTEDPLPAGKTNIDFMCSVDCLKGSARGKFALLWNKTIQKSDAPRYGWNANPWVWVITFERMN